jgi:hypothetical protein
VNLIDKAERTDGTFSRSDFAFDPERKLYVCPGGKELKKYHRAFAKPRDGLTNDGTMIHFARKQDCEACALKLKCCSNVPARKIARSVHEAARDKARAIAKTEAYAVSCRERKKVEMLFAHLKRILRLGRLRLRGPRFEASRPVRRGSSHALQQGRRGENQSSLSHPQGITSARTCKQKSSSGRRRTPGFLRHSPIDPLEQIAELRRRDRHRSIGRRRPQKATPFKPLGEQTQALAVVP